MYKILRLTRHREDHLDQAEFLGEYDAISLDPSHVLGIAPGKEETWPQQGTGQQKFTQIRRLLARRSAELPAFFGQGGILVVRLVQPARLRVAGSMDTIDSYSWWLDVAAAASEGRITASWPTEGSGPMQVLEPGHPFEGYLRAAMTYSARLTSLTPDNSRVVVLAENRTGDAVAVEVPCKRGALILVPPPTSDGGEYMLDAAIDQALQTWLGIAHEWTVADEATLSAQRDAILRDMRVKREETYQLLTSARTTKGVVLQMLHVDRAIGYYRKATQAIPIPKVCIPALWNMMEMLREHYNKGTATLASMLHLPKDDLEFLNTLANNRDLDLRHTTTGLPKPVEPAELQRALAIGKTVVQATIEYEYKAITRMRTTVAATGDGKAGS